MIKRTSKFLLSLILTISVITGIWLAWQRHGIETSSKTVELAMDFNDLRIVSALSRYPFDKLLNDIKARGIVSIGLREETLPDASTMGELYFGKSPNPLLPKLAKKKLTGQNRSYVYSENTVVRKRVQDQLRLFLKPDKIKNIGGNILEIGESDILLKDAGLGFSESVHKYLAKKGFRIIPRIANDPRFNAIGKINSLKGHDMIIFDGDEIFGYPDNIAIVGMAMKKNRIKYGLVEIIKQDGDRQLKKVMGREIVRVHSVPNDELKKISRDEAVFRFARAARERSIRLIYIRPFLPPKISEDPVKYNLEYLSGIKNKIEAAGFKIGEASVPGNVDPFGWQIIVLGLGVMIGALLLIDHFARIPALLMWAFLFASAFAMVFAGAGMRGFILEKGLALLAALVFPSYAVISQFSKPRAAAGRIYLDALYLTLNVIADTAIGIILIIGLLANTSFMLGSQDFMGIKLTLVIPILVTAAYFFFKTEKGFDLSVFRKRIVEILQAKFPVWIFISALLAFLIFGVLLARSGNFVLPVPGFEKTFRELLEKVLLVRPRTKEFLIGFPMLILASFYFLKGYRKWLPVFLAIAVIGPVSMLNSFCHIHTPIFVSVMRSLNGLVLGVLIGWLLYRLISRKA